MSGHLFLRTLTSYLFMIAILLQACAAYEEFEDGHAEDKGFYNNEVLWKTLDIPVCWENFGEIKASDRAYVQDAINETWGSVVPFNFYGWRKCQADSI